MPRHNRGGFRLPTVLLIWINKSIQMSLWMSDYISWFTLKPPNQGGTHGRVSEQWWSCAAKCVTRVLCEARECQYFFSGYMTDHLQQAFSIIYVDCLGAFHGDYKSDSVTVIQLLFSSLLVNGITRRTNHCFQIILHYKYCHHLIVSTCYNRLIKAIRHSTQGCSVSWM